MRDVVGAFPEGFYFQRFDLEVVDAGVELAVGGEEKFFVVGRPAEIGVVAGPIGEAARDVLAAAGNALGLLDGHDPDVAAEAEGKAFAVVGKLGLGHAGGEFFAAAGVLFFIGGDEETDFRGVGRAVFQQPEVRAVLEGEVAAGGRDAWGADGAAGEAGELFGFSVALENPEIRRARGVVGDFRNAFAELGNRGRGFAEGDGEEALIAGKKFCPEMLAVIGGDGLAGFVGGVEEPDLRGGGANVARARAGETVAPINDVFAVGRVARVVERGEILEEFFGGEGLHVEGEDAVIDRIALAGEEEVFAVGTPAVGRFGVGVPGELLGGAAFRRDHENIPTAGAAA